MIINNIKTTKSAGKVEMTLEAYNEMLMELHMYRSMFNLKEDSGVLRLWVDVNPMLPIIEKEVATKYPEYTERDYWIKEEMNKTMFSRPITDEEA